MQLRIASCSALAFTLTLLTTTSSSAQTLGVDFLTDYSYVDLGTPPGIPEPLGGVAFKEGDNNTLLIGGAANTAAGAIYEIGVTRNAAGHIDGYVGTATLFSTAPDIDGGLEYGPGGVLFYTGFPSNVLGQILPGSTVPDKIIDCTPLGICSSLGTLRTVPAGFANAGQVKLASYNCDDYYDVDLVADGAGTYDLVNVTLTVSLPGTGPEGIVYIDSTNPAFTADSVLIAEYSLNAVGAYEIDASGDPIPATRRDFMSGLAGAEGAETDPLNGDFLFTTFGGFDTLLIVQGFSAPTVYCSGKVNSNGCTPTIEFSGSPTISGPDDFIVTSNDVGNNAFGILMWGLAADSMPMGGGVVCVQSPTLMLPVLSSGGTGGFPDADCTGQFTIPIDQAFLGSNGFLVGSDLFLQFLGRDRGYLGADAITLSDALTFAIQP